MATFGKTTPGAGASGSNTSRVMVSAATPSSTGTVDTGHARLWIGGPSATGSSSTFARFAIYADDGGAPGDLLAVSDVVEISGTSETEWEFPFTGGNRITVTQGVTYWIGPGWLDADPDGSELNVQFSRDNTPGQRLEANIGSGNWPNLPDQFGTPVATNAGPMAAYVTYIEDSGGGPSGTPANPGEALWIGPAPGKNHFNVGIGIDDGGEDGYQPGDTVHTDQDDIEAGFVNDPKFILTEDGDVQFRIGVNDGRTSSGTNYPRSELRELDEDGDLASWDGSEGHHWMEWEFRATHLAATRPWLCMGQIHDDDQDVLRIQTEVRSGQLCLVARLYDVVHILIQGYEVGTWVKGRIDVVDGDLTVTIDGVPFNDWENGDPSIGANCYFKAGCYAQSNTDTENGDDSQYFAMEIRKGSLKHWHTGWAQPTDPVWTGGAEGHRQRFYLTNAPASWNAGVPLSFWAEDAAAELAVDNPLRLGTAPEGVPDDRSSTETSEAPYPGLLGMWISEPAQSAGKILDAFYLIAGVEATEGADLGFLLGIWVSTGDTNAFRGGDPALPNAYTAPIWPEDGTPAGRGADGIDSGLMNEIEFEAGDRIVVELGYYAQNTTDDPQTGTLHFGGTGTPDLETLVTDLTRPGWIDLWFEDEVEFGAPVTVVDGEANANLGGLTATADGEVTDNWLGEAGADLGGVAASAAGVRGVEATASSSLGGLTAQADGVVSHVNAVAPLGALTASATGRVDHRDATATTDLGPTAAATGQRETFASGAAAPAFSASSDGVRETAGSGSVHVNVVGRMIADLERPDVVLANAVPHVAFWWVDPDTGDLVPLPHVISFELSPIRNGFGHVRIDYPRNGLNYDLLREIVDSDIQPEIEIWIGGTPIGRKRALLMEAEGEDVSEESVWTFAGHFLEFRMHDAVLAPNPTPGDDWKTWFDNESPGTVVATLMQAAQARGTLTDISFDSFTDEVDSNGNEWSQVVNLELAPHRHYDEILDDLVEMGVLEWEVTPDHELKIYEPGSRGVDRTEGAHPLIVRVGGGMQEARRKFSSRDAGTDLWVAGGDGYYDHAGDPSARARYGRQIERADSQNYIIDDGALAAYIQNKIGVITSGAMELTVGVEFGYDKPQPALAFDIGDWIYIDAGQGTLDRDPLERYRVAQWSLQSDGDQITGTISVNDLMAERVSRLEKLVRGVSGGAVVVGTSLPEADSKAPAAPTGVSASSLAYTNDAGNRFAAVTVSWSPVTTNADGTALFDMSGYRIRFRYLDGTGPAGYNSVGRVSSVVTTHTFSGVLPGATIGISVQAYDRTGLDSEWSSEYVMVTATDDTPPPVPSTPTVTNYIGLLRVDWDGLGENGEQMPVDFDHVEVLASTVDDFDPDEDEFVQIATMRGRQSYAWSPPGSLGNADYGTTWFVKLRSVDNVGNVSAPSEQGSAVPGKVEEGDVASLNVGQLTSGNLTAIVANLGSIMHFVEEGGAGYILDDYGLVFYDSNGDVSFDAGGPDGTLWARGAFETSSSGGTIEIRPGDASEEVPTPLIKFWAPGALENAVVYGAGVGSGTTPTALFLRSSQNGDLSSLIAMRDDGTRLTRAKSWPPSPDYPNGSMVPHGGLVRVQDTFAVMEMATAVSNEFAVTTGGYVEVNHDNAQIGFVGSGRVAITEEEILLDTGGGGNTVRVSGTGGVLTPRVRGVNGGGVNIGTVSNDTSNNVGPEIFFYWAGGSLNIASGSSHVKTFVIDHPDDPDRWLVHACLEGPTADVFYRGTATIVDGRAEVELPGYFESATRAENRQVQVTPVGVLCRVAASRITDGKFTIISDAPDGTQVAWLVHAERADTEPFDPEPLRSEIDVQGSGPYRYFVRKDDASNVPAPAPTAAPAVGDDDAPVSASGSDHRGRGDAKSGAANRRTDLRVSGPISAVEAGRAADRVPPATTGGARRPTYRAAALERRAILKQRLGRTELTDLWKDL